MRRPRVIALAALAAALVVAGIVVAVVRPGGETKLPALPVCGRPAESIARPDELPRRFPVPDGTIFVHVGHAPPSYSIVSARMPLDLQPAARFLTRELPRAGFRLGAGEQELGFEVESDYQGNGVSGRFKVRILRNCSGATQFFVSVLPHRISS